MSFQKPPRDEVNWIETVSGKLVYPLNPIPEDFDIKDIAHALSQICRYTGQCSQFYSVGQHSVLVSKVCEEPKWGLMHDAAESMLADIARPVKKFLPTYNEVEEELLKCLAIRFDLEWPIPACVKIADARMLKTEKDAIMPESKHLWGVEIAGFEPYTEADGISRLDDLYGWPCYHARKMFIERFKELFPNERV